jgi:hypothetical protein
MEMGKRSDGRKRKKGRRGGEGETPPRSLSPAVSQYHSIYPS